MRLDNIVIYKNYLKQDTINFDISNLFHNIKCDTFDARNHHKKFKLIKLEGNAEQFLVSEYESCYMEFDRLHNGDDYIEKSNKKINNSYELFSCGKIIIKKNIQSCIVLLRSPNQWNGSVFNILVMYNFKYNKLCSIVELSAGTENGENYPSIKSYNFEGVLTTINNIGLSSDITIDHNSAISWNEFLLVLGIKKEFKSKLCYSMFRIDTIGFIRFVQIDENHIPVVLR